MIIEMAALTDVPAQRRRRVTRIVALFLGIGAGLWFLRDRPSDDEPGVHVHPGLRTTWLDGPLRPDGTVDYVEFVRAERQRGVTNENDLAPILSSCLEKPLRDVPPAADRAPPPSPLVSWSSWCLGHGIDAPEDSDVAQIESAGRLDGPRYEEIGKWLAAIGPALDLLQQEARVRDRWYQPPAALVELLGSIPWSLRTVVPCYLMRASRRNAGGDLPGARADLETALSLLGRWRGWDGLMGLTSILACEGVVAETIATLPETNRAWTCTDFRRIDAATPRTPRDEQTADALPWERLAMLELFVDAYLDSARRAKPDGPADPIPDFDRWLELQNDRFDLRAKLLMPPLAWERNIDALREREAAAKEGRRGRLSLRWDFWKRRSVSDEAASDPEAAADLVESLTVPFWRGILESMVVTTVASDAARLRFALACFRNEHGRLPRDVAEIAASCFDAPPRDRLFREPLGWTVRDDGTIDISSRGAPLAGRLDAKHAKPR